MGIFDISNNVLHMDSIERNSLLENMPIRPDQKTDKIMHVSLTFIQYMVANSLIFLTTMLKCRTFFALF
jgi:hypothetical protein